MKRVLLSCLLAVAGMACAWAQEYDFEVDGMYYNVTDEAASEVEVTSRTGGMGGGGDPDAHFGDLVVPDSVLYAGKTYRVTRIGDWAFNFCSGLTSVTLPDGLKSIGEAAFSECSGMTSVNIPAGVTSIGRGAFMGCSSLASVTLPDGLTDIGESAFEWSGLYQDASRWEDGVLYIGPYLLDVQDSLSGDYAVKDGTRVVADGAFANCGGLTSITLPAGITRIGESTFNRCSSLTSMTLPAGVTSIGEYAFYGCISLNTVTLPDGVASIGAGAFEGCGLYQDNGRWENGVLYIGPYLIAAQDSLSGDYVVKSDTRVVADAAFYRCEKLTSVALPDGITRIGESTFYRCSSLTSITLPTGVTSIGEYAFSSCNGLTSITLPAGVTSIGAYAFSSCNGLTTIILPAGVTSIGEHAFGNCSSLTSITVPDGVTSIEEHAFANCSSLTSITIPDRVTSIGDYAFGWCADLASVSLPAGLTRIGMSAFYGCSSLTSISIPDGVISIGSSAFERSGLYEDASKWENDILYVGPYLVAAKRELTGACAVKDGTRLVADGAFQGCGSLTSVALPDGVISIGEWAFQGCRSLTSVVIPDGVTSIEQGVFLGCEGLTSVVLSDGVTNIEQEAFSGCSSLASIALPDSLRSVGRYAFANCSSLTSIVIPDQVTSIGIEAFGNCAKLTSVTFGKGVKRIERDALYYSHAVQEIHCLAATPPVLNGSLFYEIPAGLTLYVPCGSEGAYQAAAYWNEFTNIVGVAHQMQVGVNDLVMGTAAVTQEAQCTGSGTTATIEATPAEGYHFVQWNDGNTDNPREIVITSDTTLTAEFAINQYQVTVNADNPDMGSVTGGGEYAYGTSATIEAVPAEGYHFVQWNDGNTDNPRTLTVTGEVTLTAEFAINTYQVTVNADNAEHGSVTGSGEYAHGASATLTAAPAEGYHFVRWSDGNTDNPRTVVVTDNLTLTAEFEPSMTTGLDEVNHQLLVTTDHRNILIYGASDSVLSVYTVQGTCIYRGTAEAEPAIIPVPSAGMYVVMVGEEMPKVVVR